MSPFPDGTGTNPNLWESAQVRNDAARGTPSQAAAPAPATAGPGGWPRGLAPQQPDTDGLPPHITDGGRHFPPPDQDPDRGIKLSATPEPELDLAEVGATKIKCPKCDHVQAIKGGKKCKNCGHDLTSAIKAKYANMSEEQQAELKLAIDYPDPAPDSSDELDFIINHLNQDDDDTTVPPDLRASDGDRDQDGIDDKCGNCFYFDTGRCQLYDYDVGADMVCNSFEVEVKPGAGPGGRQGMRGGDGPDATPESQAGAEHGSAVNPGQHLAVLLQQHPAMDLAVEVDAPGDQGKLVQKVICATGTLALSPGPGQVDVEKPLELTPEMFQGIKRAFDDGALPHVTVPETHSNGSLENTGYVRQLSVVDAHDQSLPEEIRDYYKDAPDGTQLMLAGIEFTEPEVKQKALNRSIPDTSVGVKFNYRNKRSGKTYPYVLEHVALTPIPWVDGLTPFSSTMLSGQPFDADENEALEKQWDGVFIDAPEDMRLAGEHDDESDTGSDPDGPGNPESGRPVTEDGEPGSSGDNDDDDESDDEVDLAQVSAWWDAVEEGDGALNLSIDLAAKNIKQSQRDTWAKKKIAMSDGSFPIPNVDYLKRALKAFGRAAADKRDAVKAHIKRRAKALGALATLKGSSIFASAVAPADTGDILPDEDPGVSLSDMPSVEELLARQQVQLEQEQAAREEAERKLEEQGVTLSAVTRKSHTNDVRERVRQLQDLGCPPAVLERAQQVMLADLPGGQKDGEGFNLSVTLPETEEDGTHKTKDFERPSDIVEYLLGALPLGTNSEATRLLQLTASLDQRNADKGDETAQKLSQVDAWEKETYPERFNEDGSRKQPQGAAA